MKDQIVLRTVTRGVIPFILLLGLYLLMHGKHTPGGGFQAGVIVAAAYIAHSLIYGLKATQRAMPPALLRVLGACGVLLYAGVGLVCIGMGGNFLEYGVLFPNDPVLGQRIGITLIEIAVGITVFAVMLLLYVLFVERHG